MLRSFMVALLPLFLLACASPPTAPVSSTSTPTPPVRLATFTPAPQPLRPAATPTPLQPLRPAATPTPLSFFWQLAFPGVETAQTRDGLTLLRHAPSLAQYDILFEGNPDKTQSLQQWLTAYPQAIAGVNCGFYWGNEGTYLHMGLLEQDERRLAPVRPKWGAALVLRHGVAKIVRQPKKRIPPMTLGVQGWPTLLWRGQVAAGLDDLDIARRTAVGVDASGRVVWVVDDRGSTLQSFAQRLRQKDIALVDAVNLDGGSSTGLLWRQEAGGALKGVDSLPIPCVITFSPPER